MRTDLPVMGMTCQACVARVSRELLRVDGVSSARVSLRRSRASVTSAAQVPHQALVSAIERAGYQVGEMERIALATANSELRSETRCLKEEIRRLR